VFFTPPQSPPRILSPPPQKLFLASAPPPSFSSVHLRTHVSLFPPLILIQLLTPSPRLPPLILIQLLTPSPRHGICARYTPPLCFVPLVHFACVTFLALPRFRLASPSLFQPTVGFMSSCVGLSSPSFSSTKKLPTSRQRRRWACCQDRHPASPVTPGPKNTYNAL